MFGILNVCEALISRVRLVFSPVPGIAEVVLAVPFPVVVAVGGFVVVVEVFGPVAFGGFVVVVAEEFGPVSFVGGHGVVVLLG